MKSPKESGSVEIRIMAGQIITVFIVIVLLLTVASLMGQYYKFFGGRDRDLVRLFDLDGEWNIPTAYQGFSLLICSLLIASIGIVKQRVADEFYLHWIVLSVMFFGMAVDEIVQIHEQLNQPLRLVLNAKGALHYAWVIPGSGCVIALGLFYRRFILGLGGRTRRLFIASGILYVLGAIGVEMIGGGYVDRGGNQTFTYALITNCEELLEMVGILVFMYALMSYIAQNMGEVRIRFFTR